MIRLPVFWSVAIVLGLAAGTVFFVYGMARMEALGTAAYDFAFFDQLIWNTAQGRLQHQTFVPYHFLGQHVEYAYLVLVPIYALGAGPDAMLALQSAAIGAGIPLLAGASRALTGNAWVALAVAAGYACSPYLHRAVAFDFHPETMAAGLVFGSAWAMALRRYTLAAVLAAAMLLFKEDQAISVVMLAGLLLVLSRGMAGRQAVAMALLGIGWAVVAVLVIQPAFREGATSDLVGRYSYLLSQPLVGLAQLWNGGGAAAIGSALALTVPFGLAVPAVFLLPAPHLLLAGLSTHSQQAALGLHYGASSLPLLVLAHALALARLPGLVRLPSALLVMAISAGAALTMGPLRPGAWPVPDPVRREALAAAAGIVPAEVPVRAQGNLAIAFSRRETVYEFPGAWEGPPSGWSTPWVVVDRGGHVTDQARNTGHDRVLASLPEHGFSLVFDEAGIQVYHCPTCGP